MDGRQSLDHCMLGHVMEWYYGYVAGIRQSPGSAGWKNILISPQPGELDCAEASLQTPVGRVTSRWTKRQGRFGLEVEVPPGIRATAILPSGKSVTLRGGAESLEEP